LARPAGLEPATSWFVATIEDNRGKEEKDSSFEEIGAKAKQRDRRSAAA
jgi:hypothetical protein